MKEIITAILDNLKNNVGISGKWEKGLKKENIAGYINLTINKHPLRLPAEIKNTLYNYQYDDLVQLKEKYNDLVVMAENIQPAMKQQLKKANINYADAAGNMYVKTAGHLLFIDGLKQEAIKKDLKAKPFSKAGIKVIFALFVYDDLINGTIRDIADKADVSIDSAHRTVTGLKQLGYLLPLNKDKLIWNNKKELLQRWIVEFDSRLKPDLLIGTFNFIKESDFNNWKQLPLKEKQTWWGGEPAGDLYTNHLKPAILTLYTQEGKANIIKGYRLIPDLKGNIMVYNKFWKDNEEGQNVHPLLVYTDLMNTGDSRNIETAKKVYEQFLQDKF